MRGDRRNNWGCRRRWTFLIFQLV